MIDLVYIFDFGFIQWAFLERDESQPANGNFWTDDDGRSTEGAVVRFRLIFSSLEPIPCLMDNWGEGVVPACREERTEEFVTNCFFFSVIYYFS